MLDSKLLEKWAVDKDFFLLPQDEEMLLGQEQNLDIILDVLDSKSILEEKVEVLMDALFIIAFDLCHPEYKRKDEKLKQRVLQELNKRPQLLKKADLYIADYLKEVVYPQLDQIKTKSSNEILIECDE